LIYSKYFALTLKDIDEGLAGDESRDDAMRKGGRIIARQLLGRKGLTEKDRAICNELLTMAMPDSVAECLDEYFTREMIRKIPKMVERTMRLSTLGVEIS